MPPKTKKTALSEQLERRAWEQREKYAADQGMAPEMVADPTKTDVYINRIGNAPQNVLINRVGAGPGPGIHEYGIVGSAVPPPAGDDPQKRSAFSRYSPLGLSLLSMFRQTPTILSPGMWGGWGPSQ